MLHVSGVLSVPVLTRHPLEPRRFLLMLEVQTLQSWSQGLTYVQQQTTRG